MKKIETLGSRKPLKMTALAIAAAQLALMYSGGALAQTGSPADAQDVPAEKVVVVTGQRKQLETSQRIKQEAEQIVDSVVADEAGKLPDKSITEVLQRVVGVTMDRNTSRTRTNAASNPLSYNVEGSGVQIRGLSWGSSTLNGREGFSAGFPGRELSWGDIPPELMAGVDVYKNPSSELIEGGISGQVNLRTRLPFDSKGQSGAFSVSDSYTPFGKKNTPSFSGLYSNRWSSDMGEVGALIDVSYGKSAFRSDSYSLGAYYPLSKPVPGQTVWVPNGTSWGTGEGKSERAGVYAALQWKKNDKESSLTYFDSGFRSESVNGSFFSTASDGNSGLTPYDLTLTNAQYDAHGVLQKGTLSYPGGLGRNQFAAGGLSAGTSSSYDNAHGRTRDISWNAKWRMDERWTFQSDLQWVHATNGGDGNMINMGTFVPSMSFDLTTPRPTVSFDAAARAALADPGNYFFNNLQPYLNKSKGDMYAWKGDAKFVFDSNVLRDLRFGVRLTKRSSSHAIGVGSGWYSLSEPWSVFQSPGVGRPPTAAEIGNSWQSRGNFGYLSDPRYAALAPVQQYAFPNFFNGRVGSPPTIVVPTMAAVRNYPAQDLALVAVKRLQCEDGNRLKNTNNDCSTQGADWRPMIFSDNPADINPQNPLQGALSTASENTQAMYGTLRFGFDDLKYPVEGNVGARVVRSSAQSHGYTVFNPQYSETTNPALPRFGVFNEPLDVKGSHVDVIPSLNLKVSLTDKLQSRLALSQGISRPGFDQVQEYVSLQQKVDNATVNGVSTIKSVSYVGTNSGNANLKPLKSNNFDLSLEWYPQSGQSLTAVVFYKKIKDIIMTDTYTRSIKDLAGNPQEFVITGPANAAKLWEGGIEIAGQTYLDKIPGLAGIPDWAKGFGISANWTYLDGKQDLYHPYTSPYCPKNGSSDSLTNLYGCDTNGLPFKDLPVVNLSKHAFNLGLMYDRGPVSARLAYSWRSRTLLATNAFGAGGSDAVSADPARLVNGVAPTDVGWGLPVWQEAVGQWDASLNYNFTDKLWASASVSNLTQTVTRQTNQQFIGNTGRSWFDPGRSFKVAMGYHF
ncbi:TonB-dependent receptor [Duganella vulcania]|uniref:TonB-dependent receptor n=1 Tax=Duganella vulcania TaxID=2692166 RepID=A0A845H0R4_9BURK|nr:TonB-dependent receptor [Duganella vulcania]MYM98299.1 TonB-dependent receptor [Duganella vulcania]